MKNTVKFLSLVILMVLFSCSSEPIIQNETSELSDLNRSAAKKSYVAVMDVMGEIKGASATLNRKENGISAKLKTIGLIPGNAYTMWFVVFGETPGPPKSTFAAGHVIGGSGKAEFSGHKSFEEGVFENPLTAEVHLVIRTHGPAQPGMIPSMIHTMDGGCESGFPSGPGLHADSDVVGYCANIQVAINPSVN